MNGLGSEVRGKAREAVEEREHFPPVFAHTELVRHQRRDNAREKLVTLFSLQLRREDIQDRG